jgi:hypothetical protein
LKSALEAGWSGFEIAERIPLSEIARAHELLEHEGRRSCAGATRNGSQVRAGGARSEETEKRLADLHVRTLEETLARQAAQIVALEKQLVEAKQQVQDIAVKAIEGASGRRRCHM